MAVDDVYLLSLRATLNGQQVVNTLAFRLLSATAPSAVNLGTLATAIKDVLRAQQVNDLVWSDWTALEVRGAGVTYATSSPFRTTTVAFSGAFGGTAAGALTGTPATNQEAYVLAINTAQSGRRRKGRIFIAGVHEAGIADSSVVEPSQVTTLQTAFNTGFAPYLVGGANTDHRLGVWSHRIASNTALNTSWPRQTVTMGAPSPSTAFADAESVSVRAFVGSQRNRRPGI